MMYLLRRLLNGLFLLLGISLASFALAELAPGDFLQEMRLNPQISSQTVAALRAQYGLDRPLPQRYLLWVKSVLKGELGFSFTYNRPVIDLLRPRICNTLILTVTAMLLSWFLAVPLGIWSATQHGKWGDRLCGAATSLLLAIPDIVLALGLLLLALRTGWFPAGGMISAGYDKLTPWGKAVDVAHHLILPCLALVFGMSPILARHVRSAALAVLDAPFVRAARVHGIHPRRVLWFYVLPVAANPLISLLGFSIGTLLSFSLLVEVVMSWPGLGPLVLEAILSRDIHLVIGSVICSTLFLVAGNFLADLLLYAADPRIRKE